MVRSGATGCGLLFAGALVSALSGPVAAAPVSDDPRPAKELFGAAGAPADMESLPVGGYARGCLAGGEQLPVNGADWQVMRLSRNRNWGHPDLVAYIKWLARGAREVAGWNGLLIGDMAQPRGGPMLTGHASHQTGLDADIWMRPMPARRLSRAERESMSSISMVSGRRSINARTWTRAHMRLLKRAASNPRVARIFVNPPIKKALCDMAGPDRAWLRRIRPWYGHQYHFHVRLKCPANAPGCRDQAPPPPGDGCGRELAWWLSDAPYKPKPKVKGRKRREVRLRDLPGACERVLAAGDKRDSGPRTARVRSGRAPEAAVTSPPGRNSAPAKPTMHAVAPETGQAFLARKEAPAPIPRRKPQPGLAPLQAGAGAAVPLPRRKPVRSLSGSNAQTGPRTDFF